MFITFEGLDFCGKSTQVALLVEYLKNKNYKVEVFREPGGTKISESIRDLLLDKKNSGMFLESEIFLFSAARAQIVREKIIPLLEKGYFVICDRFHDSTTAYQGFGRVINLDLIKTINKYAIDKAVPDLTFLIDIPVYIAEERKSKKNKRQLDRIELSEKFFFERVREGYLYLDDVESRIKKIDGTLGISEIHNLIINILENLKGIK